MKLDKLEQISEEIELMMGLKSVVSNNVLYVDTITGVIEVKIGCYKVDVMQSVYRFLVIYGIRLQKYGQDYKKY